MGGQPNFDWAGLLRWSSQYIDGTDSANSISHLDPERFEFLQKAVKEAMKNTVDPNQVMIEARNKITLNANDEAVVLSALVAIDRCVDIPECARNLVKLGLVEPLLSCLSMNDEIKSLSFYIMSRSMQNNLPVQEGFSNCGALSIIRRQIYIDDYELIQSRALAALAALLRHNHNMEIAFLSDNGLYDISKLLLSEHLKVREKALSLLKHFILENLITSKDILYVNNGQIIGTIMKLVDDNSNGILNIQYSEILSETLLQIINCCKLDLSEKLQDEVLKCIRRRQSFLADYAKIHPEDDTSPEVNLLKEYEGILGKSA
ncbi:hypothetical protein ACR3K2_16500 [Cryptosporidium serpentis]